jgi:hypothetical protein
MLRRHITCQFDRRRALSTINAEDARLKGLTSGSARWLTSRAVGHVAASDLRLSGELKRTRHVSRHVSAPDPCLALTKAREFFVPESWDPTVSGPDPTQRGPGPVPGVWFIPVEVLDLARRFDPCMQGSGTFP